MWKLREGLILRIEDEAGRFGFGEVAPIPWFGSERYEDALAWCKVRGGKLNMADLRAVPGELRCLKVALGDALSAMQEESEVVSRSFECACLMSMSGEAMELAEQRIDEGFHCFKFKVGVRELEREQAWLKAFMDRYSDPSCRIRLDANGGLSEAQFLSWMKFLEDCPVEYLEQPLPVGEEWRMQELGQGYSTVLALDESLNAPGALQNLAEWTGLRVVKPLLLPELDALPAKLSQSMVGSSVFETAFGLAASLRKLSRIQKNERAIGYGVGEWFDKDGWDLGVQGAIIESGSISDQDLQQLWIRRDEQITD